MRTVHCVMSLAILGAVAAAPVSAQAPQPSRPPVMSGTIEVTTTKAPIAVERVPASVTVITGDDLRARGATDLASALDLVAGVSIAPGGDGGPAGSVPELWGLREFDAFLLVVDGVPWGGAFNPALPAIDMTDVDRIEIVRGAAPVMYGATSFSGVIQIIHRAPGAPGGEFTASAGSHGSGSLSWAAPLASSGGVTQSLAASAERRGFRDDRTNFDRGHLLYRAAVPTANGSFRFDLDGVIVNQEPASPHPRTGAALSPLVPVDANHNPLDSKIDENRIALIGGYERPFADGTWSTTLSYTHTSRDTGRGFLTDVSSTDPNANGYRQDLTLDDVYFDSHLAFNASPDLVVTLGVDHLYGSADQDSEDFDYFASLDGSTVPRLGDLEAAGHLKVKDTRNFSGPVLADRLDTIASVDGAGRVAPQPHPRDPRRRKRGTRRRHGEPRGRGRGRQRPRLALLHPRQRRGGGELAGLGRGRPRGLGLRGLPQHLQARGARLRSRRQRQDPRPRDGDGVGGRPQGTARPGSVRLGAERLPDGHGEPGRVAAQRRGSPAAGQRRQGALQGRRARARRAPRHRPTVALHLRLPRPPLHRLRAPLRRRADPHRRQPAGDGRLRTRSRAVCSTCPNGALRPRWSTPGWTSGT